MRYVAHGRLCTKRKVQIMKAAIYCRLSKEDEYKIVGSQEADPLKGKLSNATPLGETLIGAKVGQTVTVHHVEEPYDVKILEIK